MAGRMRRRFNWKLAVVLLVVLGLLGGGAYGGRKWLRERRARQALDRGLKAYDAKDWTAAVADLGRYCGVHGQDTAVLLKYADAQMQIRPQKSGNVQQAVSAYRQILRQEAGQPEACHRVSQIYVSGGAPGDAELILRQRLASDSQDTVARLILASAYVRQRKFGEAAAEVNKVIAQAPDAIEAYTFLIALAQQRPEDVSDKPDSVLARLEKAQQDNPTSESLGLYVAGRRMSARKFAEAQAILDRLNPSSPGVLAARIALALNEGRRQDALGLCDTLVATTNDARAYTVRAQTRVALGLLDPAQADYEQVTRLQPGEAGNWLLLANFLVRRDKIPEAIKAVDQALTVEPDSPAAVVSAANLFSRSDDPALRARIDPLIEGALAANPENLGLQVVKAQRILTRMTPDALKQARQLLDDVTRKNPAVVDAWRLMAEAAVLQNLPDAALDALAKGLAAAPDDRTRVQLLGFKAQVEQSRWPPLAAATRRQIAETIRPAWEKDKKDVNTGLALANALLDAGDPAQAVAVLQEMRPLVTPDQAPQIDLPLARATALAGDPAKALEMAQKLRTDYPDRSEPVFLTVDLLARAGRWADLKPLAADWQKAHPKDVATPIRAGQILLGRADALLAGAPPDPDQAAKARQAAQDVIQVCLAQNPDNADAKAYLAAACQTAGKIDQAETLYRDILAKTPDHAVAINNLAWLLCEDRGKRDEALTLAERGRARWPQFPDLIDTQGMIYYRLGRLDDARKAFEDCRRVATPNSAAGAAAVFHLARVLADQGPKPEAVLYLNAVLLRPATAGGLSPKDRAEAEALLKKLTAE